VDRGDAKVLAAADDLLEQFLGQHAEDALLDLGSAFSVNVIATAWSILSPRAVSSCRSAT